MAESTNSNAVRNAAAITAVALILAGTVLTLNHQRETAATVTTPGVKIDTHGSDIKIDAPYTSIQKDSSGTRIRAPGVDIDLPPGPAAEPAN